MRSSDQRQRFVSQESLVAITDGPEFEQQNVHGL
jgi:hypothetical protein